MLSCEVYVHSRNIFDHFSTLFGGANELQTVFGLLRRLKISSKKFEKSKPSDQFNFEFDILGKKAQKCRKKFSVLNGECENIIALEASLKLNEFMLIHMCAMYTHISSIEYIDCALFWHCKHHLCWYQPDIWGTQYKALWFWCDARYPINKLKLRSFCTKFKSIFFIFVYNTIALYITAII